MIGEWVEAFVCVDCYSAIDGEFMYLGERNDESLQRVRAALAATPWAVGDGEFDKEFSKAECPLCRDWLGGYRAQAFWFTPTP